MIAPGDGGGLSPIRLQRAKGGEGKGVSFLKCLLITYCVPGPGLGAGATAVDKAEKPLSSWG